ncbi:MAG: hypothetical protein J6A83_00350 [Clostridia bacterium]|nr:hypothetical protein [Clostridia bacterium]
MTAFLLPMALGILISVIGVLNMKGNISSLHRYHRHRVTEADIKPFGKAVGLGTLICGLACIFFGIMLFIYDITALALFSLLGVAGLIGGLAVGMVISLRAIIKYNKGLF